MRSTFTKKIGTALFATILSFAARAVSNVAGGTSDPVSTVDTATTADGFQHSQEPPGLRALRSENQVAATPGVDTFLSMGNNEPIIAADPNNPLRIAVATFLGIRVSTDGGVTFQPRVNVVAPAGFNTNRGGDSSLGYDSQGRLFWTFLLNETASGGSDVFIAQVNPTTGAILAGYPVNVSAGAGVPNDGGTTHNHDKEWLAVDHFAGSPFQDSLYIVWTDFQPAGVTAILTTFSVDQGANWSPALTLSAAGEGFVWPSDNTVAPNGDVYVAYHSQTGFTPGTCTGGGPGCSADGASGRIFVVRSVNGGATYPQKNLAYAAGDADVTFNVQSGPRTIPGSVSWFQGSVQPQLLADPLTPGRIYVVVNDQQPNTSTDRADIFIVVSTNDGVAWGTPTRIDSGPAGTFQVMPFAEIDPVDGCIIVTYYDSRSGVRNAGNDFLLDVYAVRSADGGVTFTPDFPINTQAFDPDLNAPCRFGPAGCGNVDTVRTLRIGEYNGLAAGGDAAYAVWTGNDTTNFQDTVFARFAGCTNACPSSHGYWKTRPEAWPVSALSLGSQVYSQAELLVLLSAPTRNDASIILARQLIAAKLNIANGSDPGAVSSTIADADNLLSRFAGKLPYSVRVNSVDGKNMVGDSKVLDSYNNRGLTPTCTP